jgi:anti-sigma factor RsiW
VTARGECPTEQQIAAFVDGGLALEQRRVLERHVDECSACFDLVATLAAYAAHPVPTVETRLRERALVPRGRSRAVRWAPALATAAAVVVVAVWWNAPQQSIPRVNQQSGPSASLSLPDDAVRSLPGDGALVIVAPHDGEQLRGSQIVRWRSIPKATSYEVQVTTVAGDVVLKRQVAGSDHEARIEISPAGDTAYFVWVAAYLPEGRRITSNVLRVRWTPSTE